MKAPGPGTLQFLYGSHKYGFLDYVARLWRQHGDVFEVRLGRKRLMFVLHPDGVEHATVKARQRYDKGASVESTREFLLGDGLVASTGPLWKRQRRLMSPFFTPRGVQSYADGMRSDALEVCERWESLSRSGKEVEIGDEMTALTASIILKSMFSVETVQSIERLREAIEAMISFTTRRGLGVPLPLWLPTATNRRYKEARELVHGSVNRVIADRRRMPQAEWPHDLLTGLMSSRDEETGEGMSDTLLRDEAITAFVAGHETTARTMTAAWYALARNPQVAERLHREVDEVLGDQPPSLNDLQKLPYCLSVVKEVLRVYPPAPIYSRDSLEADRIAGYDVLPETVMLFSPYFTHRHPAFWKDPERFMPERWAGKGGASERAFIPFGSGQRICIGSHFALLESHLLLATLAQRFAPRLRAGHVARWEMHGVLTPANGMPMTIEARSPQWGKRELPAAGRAARGPAL